VCFERTVSAPFGVCGGQSAKPAKVAVRLSDGEERKLNSKQSFIASPGSTIIVEAPGGGGYGDPRQRDRAALAKDAQQGYVTEESAKAYR